jgi:hypothetical protein
MTSRLAAIAARGLRIGRRDIRWVALFGCSFAVAAVGAALPQAAVFAVGLAATYAVDVLGAGRRGRLFDLIGKAQLGSLTRELVRCGALVLFAWRTGRSGLGGIIAVVAAFVLLRAGYVFAVEVLAWLRGLPIETRNVDLSALRIPDAPRPAVLAHPDHRANGLLGIPLSAGVLLQFLGTPNAAVVGGMITVALAVATDLVMAVAILRARHLADRAWLIQVVQDQVTAFAPEVVIYHSAPPGGVYQINQWLDALAALDRRALVITRQPLHLADLGRTPLPVLAIPAASDVMNLDLTPAKLILYVTNVGENLHILRSPDLKHVFVGHGDSDKTSSINRVAKMYDEVWVAGPAGRDRYRLNDVGVSDDAVVEVGRPQLAAISPKPPAGDLFTIFYAPTWEGWSEDMFVTSLPRMGVEIATRLLAASGVRVIFRPHPLSGIRSAPVRAAQAEVIRLLGGPTALAPTAEVLRLQKRLAELLPPFPAYADPTERARDSRPRAAAMREADAIQAELDDLFWSQLDPSAPVVVSTKPSMYSCFNQTHLLISDISSVASDFTASGKPYVVTNPGGVPDDRFRAENTAARGAYVLSAGRVGELDGIITAVRARGEDPMAGERLAVREYLLGPAHLDAVTRFEQAVEAGLKFRRNSLVA